VLLAQAVAVNTELEASIPLSTSFFVGGVWGYEDASGRFALVSRHGHGLAVVDCTDPAASFLLTNVPAIQAIQDVMVYGTWAYAGGDGAPLQIVDLSVPAAAATVATMNVGAHTIQIDGNRLYLNRQFAGMEIYDLATNPLAPALLGLWPLHTHDSTPAGNLCYAFGQGGARILDVSNPAAISQVGVQIPSGIHSGAVTTTPAGQVVLLTCDDFAGGHLRLWDVTNPLAWSFLSSYQTDPTTSIHNVEVKGAYAFVSYFLDGFRAVEIADPLAPVEVGLFDDNPSAAGGIFSGTDDVYPFHDAVYLTERFAPTSGLRVVEFFPGFGSGCAGGGAGSPELRWSFGPPSPGNSVFALRVEDATPGALVLLWLSTSASSWMGIPLPADLAGVGAPGCSLRVAPDLILPGTTSATGTVSFALPVPAVPPGAVLYAQAAVSGATNPLGFAFTQGGKLIVE
jgi:hypothetical protein